MVTFESLQARQDKIAVVGLGYVGLPLAVHLAAHFDVVGYDLKSDRIAELQAGHDRTLEVSNEELAASSLLLTDKEEALAACRLIIVAVPTPIDAYNIPDLSPLRGASTTAGRHLQKGACVVFESTVYPGATEEVCVPLLEKASSLEFGTDFTVGYSPERINPGDKIHTLDKITKIKFTVEKLQVFDSNIISPEKELDSPTAILNMGEGDLPHGTHCPDTTDQNYFNLFI